jgi:hypothetical protein
VDDRRTSVERLIGPSIDDPAGALTERARQTRRSVEAYLKAGIRPRWMERLLEIDRAVAHQQRRLQRAYDALQVECGGDAEVFAARWRSFAHTCDFQALNELIRQHNEWYPIERDLPMNPRTGEYVLVSGRSYRRPELGEQWVLERFPPRPSAARDQRRL